METEYIFFQKDHVYYNKNDYLETTTGIRINKNNLIRGND